ncbi:uncharacterized protein N7477_000812 [Penicillium maclennaniae]|uniref:uncharacterized protein n=1 Tax=Penicillium maclennaniae TaxID=1343394 RepID=UPI00253F7F71|nr:uncharacterized protein N7477_000812 [Penicillium maclennaniae]KAJ5684467.1 hypothetical protein N7477_000812 [Penicillium maclennaniae]
MAASSKESKYRIKVTAGPDYDPATHQNVHVNGDTLRIDNDRVTLDLAIRIQDYKGYPENSPTTNPYFEDPLHTNDQYSISISFTPKEDINGNDLVFGNDFDKPLRDRLPMGFNAALRLVKWTLDPSIDGDAYADKPYLYSPALATWNQFRIGDKGHRDVKGDYVVKEGADATGEEVRSQLQIPETPDGRRKHFQTEANRQAFVFEKGRSYLADFGNQYLCFSDISVKLPGFHIPVEGMVDDEHNELRYVLKDSKTGTVYLVVLFTLLRNPAESEQAPSSGEPVNEIDETDEVD